MLYVVLFAHSESLGFTLNVYMKANETSLSMAEVIGEGMKNKFYELSPVLSPEGIWDFLEHAAVDQVVYELLSFHEDITGAKAYFTPSGYLDYIVIMGPGNNCRIYVAQEE